MPASRRGEWEHLLKIEDDRKKRTMLEEYLDRGIGECFLHDPRVAGIAEAAMLQFHYKRYELLAWCVMPNHIHDLVHVWDWPLWKMVQNWKVRVENQRRKLFLMQREYWDTFMRVEAQEKTAIRYIENNPVKAKLCQCSGDWPFSSARCRDNFRRLILLQ